MLIAIPLFERVTALDAVGPYEVLQRLPEAEVRFIGESTGFVTTENGMLRLGVDGIFDDTPDPDVVIVPGGVGTRALIPESPLVDWLRSVHPGTRWTTSVCTGSLVLAAAGLLDGLAATTHWANYQELEALGAHPTGERVVEHADRRIITAAGVSSGIDMALRLAEHVTDRVTAQAMQLLIEYDPQPPFDAGSVAVAGPEVLARAAEISRHRD